MAQSPSIPNYPHDAASLYASRVLDSYIEEKNPIFIPPQNQPFFESAQADADDVGGLNAGRMVPIHSKNTKVAIVGAGVGGLYAALILRSVGISFDIFEMDNRVGGRLKTHHFSDEENDYYNIGATRFPNTRVFRRAFDLFKGLDMTVDNGKLYPFPADSTTNTILNYNDISKPKYPSQTITAEEFNFPNIPSPYGELGVDALVDYVIQPFADGLKKDLESGGRTGWELLMRYDADSARSYMIHGPKPDDQDQLNPQNLLPYPTIVINWLETVDTSTGAFDRALSEAVIDALFYLPDDPDTSIDWFGIQGGSQVLADNMLKKLSSKSVKLNTRVTKIAWKIKFPDFPNWFPEKSANLFGKKPPKLSSQVEVTYNTPDGSKSQTYDHVILTTTIPNLRPMDLSEAGLTISQHMALRQLQYGPAVKIGVKFKTAWWGEEGPYQPQFGPILGGVSQTDRLVRMVVYPPHDGGSTVLLCAHAWTKDALQLLPMLEESPETVKDLICRDLVAVHGLDPDDGYDFLSDQWVEAFNFCWASNPMTTGAFGYFGPGQYKRVYPVLKTAAAGRLHFAGEGVSERHAWIVGALDASWRATFEVIFMSFLEKRDSFRQQWRLNEGWDMNHVCKLLAIWDDEKKSEEGRRALPGKMSKMRIGTKVL